MVIKSESITCRPQKNNMYLCQWYLILAATPRFFSLSFPFYSGHDRLSIFTDFLNIFYKEKCSQRSRPESIFCNLGKIFPENMFLWKPEISGYHQVIRKNPRSVGNSQYRRLSVNRSSQINMSICTQTSHHICTVRHRHSNFESHLRKHCAVESMNNKQHQQQRNHVLAGAKL